VAQPLVQRLWHFMPLLCLLRSDQQHLQSAPAAHVLIMLQAPLEESCDNFLKITGDSIVRISSRSGDTFIAGVQLTALANSQTRRARCDTRPFVEMRAHQVAFPLDGW